MWWSNDPIEDAELQARAEDLFLERCPRCHRCDRHIQDGSALHYQEGEIDLWLCTLCVETVTERVEVDWDESI